MGEFTIQISTDLVNKLVDDPAPKKKTRRVKRRAHEKQQSNASQKQISDGSGKHESATAPGWPVQPPIFLPATVPIQPAHSELDGIRSVLQESEKVLEKLEKQEESMLQEVTQKAKDLRDKEYKLPDPKPEPCMAEKLATLTCYSEHIKDPLKCSGLVSSFADCLRKFGRVGDK